MGYQALVVGVVLLHWLFVGTAVFGGLLVRRFPNFIFVHVPIFLWAGVIVLTTFVCPLTLLENYLRPMAGLQVYTEGFLAHYLQPVFAAMGMNLWVAWLGIFILLLNAGIYAANFLVFPRRTDDDLAAVNPSNP